jgi:hypothetical protein
MAIVGFNFTRMQTERLMPLEGKISINNNVSIKDISRMDLTLGSSKEPALRFLFEFTSEYEPKIGNITLNGDVTYLADEKRVQEILKDWKKDKRINKDLMTTILNHVLTKCNVQALLLSKEVNLPPPIPLPKLKPEGKA